MTSAIELIYGEDVIEDLEYCSKHNDVIVRYAHGIMTLQGSPRATLESIAMDPASVPGWKESLERRPGDCEVLKGFFNRFIRYLDASGRFR